MEMKGKLMEHYILAMETGGTKIQFALGTKDGEILAKERGVIKPEDGRDGILAQIRAYIPVMKAHAEELGGEIARIGIGYGGPVDTKAGITIGSAQVGGWNNFHLAEYIKNETDIPTYVYNDSNAAAWGEYKKGVGQGSRIFFYTNIGSGIGGGIVIDGKLFDGQGTGAAEFGQTYFYNPEKAEESLNYPVNHLEKYCSGWAIQNRLRKDDIPADSLIFKYCGGDQSKITSVIWGKAIQENDAYALSVLDRVAEYYALGLCNVIALISPEVIAIGGGISLIGEPLISRVRRYADKYVYHNMARKYRIEKCRLDEEVVIVGTMLLAGAEGD